MEYSSLAFAPKVTPMGAAQWTPTSSQSFVNTRADLGKHKNTNSIYVYICTITSHDILPKTDVPFISSPHTASHVNFFYVCIGSLNRKISCVFVKIFLALSSPFLLRFCSIYTFLRFLWLCTMHVRILELYKDSAIYPNGRSVHAVRPGDNPTHTPPTSTLAAPVRQYIILTHMLPFGL